MTPEGKVKLKVRRWLKDNMPGAWLYAAPGGTFGKAGTPDDIGLWRGRFFAVESKADRGCTLTDLQRKTLMRMKGQGAIVAALFGFEEKKLVYIRDAIIQSTPHWEYAHDTSSTVRGIRLADPSGRLAVSAPEGDDTVPADE